MVIKPPLINLSLKHLLGERKYQEQCFHSNPFPVPEPNCCGKIPHTGDTDFVTRAETSKKNKKILANKNLLHLT